MSGDSKSPRPPQTSIFAGRDPPSPGSSMFSPDEQASAEKRAETPVDEKPNTTEKSNTIAITVRDGHNDQNFKMRRDKPLKKLMLASSQFLGKDLKACRFMLEGRRVQETDTPEKLDMVDDDIIEIFTEQIGGVVYLRGKD